ncbi:MAG: tetratricopeptide repeat protein, partial [Nitrosotalea sp.]
MRLPSWHEFNEKINELNKTIAENIATFKNDYPALDRVLTAMLSNLPFFGPIATSIYSSYPSDLPPQQKAEHVLSYFKDIQSRGEKHYDKIATKLDAILVDVTDPKQITAKEIMLETIREIIVTNNALVDFKLDYLKNEMGQFGQTVHKIDEARSKEIENMRTELERHCESINISKDFLLREASGFYYSSNYEKALEYYDQILKVDPKDVKALYNKGLALENLGRNEEAITYYDK